MLVFQFQPLEKLETLEQLMDKMAGYYVSSTEFTFHVLLNVPLTNLLTK